MNTLRVSVRDARRAAALAALCIGALAAGPANAGGLLTYEFGTAEVGLASAGYGARAQDASTVFTNPAGMTRLEGNQFLAAGQLIYGRTEFGIGLGTSPALGADAGGNAFGSNGWFPGGGGFYSHSISSDLKVGVAFYHRSTTTSSMPRSPVRFCARKDTMRQGEVFGAPAGGKIRPW